MSVKSVSLIFPHQLFLLNPSLSNDRMIYLVEEHLFFNQYNFHQQKIVFHRATMKYFKHFLEDKKYQVEYIEATSNLCDVRQLVNELHEKGCQQIHVADVIDNWLEKRLKQQCIEKNIELHIHNTPYFLNATSENEDYLKSKNKFFQADFYKYQRISKKILIEGINQPKGGKWSFDAENRKKISKEEILPKYNSTSKNNWISEAKKYSENNFGKNNGELNHSAIQDEFIYPVTHQDAEAWLDNFLEKKFEKFGIYEDAMLIEEPFLFHSILSPMLNVGLLIPQQIVELTIQKANEKKIPINSLEGFIRQIIGWREYIRMVYEKVGSQQRNLNHFSFTRKIPKQFYDGTTGIDPIDIVIKRLNKYAYTHHIERLMLLGNFMLLCEFNPNEVYRWFMEMYIDSYDWVMVPNIYGMSQFADGGMMTTKPYICGSNYILKMSNFKKGKWCEIWDALFWRFLMAHRNVFEKNIRWRMLLATLDKMDIKKREQYLKTAEEFIAQLEK